MLMMALYRRSIFVEGCLMLLLIYQASSKDEYDFDKEDSAGDYSFKYLDEKRRPDYTTFFNNKKDAKNNNEYVLQKQHPLSDSSEFDQSFESFFDTPTSAKKNTLPVPLQKPKSEDPFKQLEQRFILSTIRQPNHPDPSNKSKYPKKAAVKIISPAIDEKQTKKDDIEEDEQIGLSSQVVEKLKNGCKQIESLENTKCFVCEDPANKAKYTQCSYVNDKKPDAQNAASSIYSNFQAPPLESRYKRSPKRKYKDPYHQISSQTQQYLKDYEKELAEAESESKKEFEYSPETPEDYESFSESQSSKLVKEPGSCRKIQRKGMTCTICKNSKGGGNFEQCSYATAPNDKKYAYTAEKNYDSDDDDEPEESKITPEQVSKEENGEYAAESALVPTYSQPLLQALGTTVDVRNKEPEKYYEYPDESDDEPNKKSSVRVEDGDDEEDDENHSHPYYEESTNTEEEKKKGDSTNDPYEVPEHFAASIKNSKSDKETDDQDYDYKLFPEAYRDPEINSEEESRLAPQKQNVEDVLAEFSKKDRSNCKKAEKNGMTCFLCVDKNKIQHEECMYVAESKPKASHIAYHGVQRLKSPKPETPTQDYEETKARPIDVAPPASKKLTKKIHPTTEAPLKKDYNIPSPIYGQKKRYSRDTSKADVEAERVPEEKKEEKKEEKEEPETPEEIDVGDEEGAYSHETEPVYSKTYGTTLPKYMIEKTEYEKDFDAFSGFD